MYAELNERYFEIMLWPYFFIPISILPLASFFTLDNISFE